MNVAIGDKHQKLTITGFVRVPAGNTGRMRRDLLCECECGKRGVRVQKSKLLDGSKVDCGCGTIKRIREAAVRRGATYHKHNMVGTPTYYSWAGMKARCMTRSNTRFADYGGRGIKVCERWMDFRNFLADMGERPEGKTLDRIDVDGDYEPANCRWADRFEQAANKRKE